jgi:hypothetical protein
MPEAVQELANQKFLDRTIAAKAIVILATAKDEIRPNSALAWKLSTCLNMAIKGRLIKQCLFGGNSGELSIDLAAEVHFIEGTPLDEHCR